MNRCDLFSVFIKLYFEIKCQFILSSGKNKKNRFRVPPASVWCKYTLKELLFLCYRRRRLALKSTVNFIFSSCKKIAFTFPALSFSVAVSLDQPLISVLQAEEITLTIGQAFDLAYKKFLELSKGDINQRKQDLLLQKKVSASRMRPTKVRYNQSNCATF